MLPVPPCAVTSVCKSRGILSLDKHVALSAAVTSWNGNWHKVAPRAKNKRRYTAEQGKIEGREFQSAPVIIPLVNVPSMAAID